MNNHLIAKDKVKVLTSHFEKKLYMLKYGHDNFDDLTDELYITIRKICVKDKLQFPLEKINGNIKLNLDIENLFGILLHLAKVYSIRLECSCSY